MALAFALLGDTAVAAVDHGKKGCLNAARIYDGDPVVTNEHVALTELRKVHRDPQLERILDSIAKDHTNQRAFDRLQTWCRSHYRHVERIHDATLTAPAAGNA